VDLHATASTAAASEVPKRVPRTHINDDAAAAGVGTESLTQVPCNDHEGDEGTRKVTMVTMATTLRSYLLCDVHLFAKQ
jgi:hypothetical protein